MGVYPNYQLTFLQTGQSNNMPGHHDDRRVPGWFSRIPPERVGLDGQYDHHGLQKRVEVAYEACFSNHELACISVSQRGRVVVLQGRAADRATVQHLVEIAKHVEGAIRVESAGVAVDPEAALAATTVNR